MPRGDDTNSPSLSKQKQRQEPRQNPLIYGHSGPAWGIQGSGTHYLMVKSLQVHG